MIDKLSVSSLTLEETTRLFAMSDTEASDPADSARDGGK